MSQLLLRSAVLAYVLLLCLALRPVSELPLIGGAQAHAARLLRVASLLPGMSVFRGYNTGDFAPHDSCFEVTGHANGESRALYAPECPHRGTRWRHDPLDAAISHMVQGDPQPLLVDPLPPPSEAPDIVRNAIALGDYFCHQEPGLDRVVMRRVRYFRDMRDGSPAAPGEALVCSQRCRLHYTPLECSLRRSEVFLDVHSNESP